MFQLKRREKEDPLEGVEAKQKATNTKSGYQTQGPGWIVQTPQADTVDSDAEVDVIGVLSFFLSWVSKTQPNHWTKRMANTRSAVFNDVEGGLETLEKEMNEILGSKREDFRNGNLCKGPRKVPVEVPEDSWVLRVRHVWFPTSDRLFLSCFPKCRISNLTTGLSGWCTSDAPRRTQQTVPDRCKPSSRLTRWVKTVG